jgi:hypothetical protein
MIDILYDGKNTNNYQKSINNSFVTFDKLLKFAHCRKYRNNVSQDLWFYYSYS